MSSEIQDVHVQEYIPLMTPKELLKELPLTEKAWSTVIQGREQIKRILRKHDNRLLVITGPCSVHDEESAIDYARHLAQIKSELDDRILLVMRVYFEKPRTTVGWKGLINDPELDGSLDMAMGLKKARRILLQINELGIPAATEMLEPVIPQYIADLISWVAIGARTTESQTHRQMTSGLSMPVGFKNATDGAIQPAINAMLAAKAGQSFLGMDYDGRVSMVKTRGNQNVHIVLRGGIRPNYDSVSIEDTRSLLAREKLEDLIMVDCSHGNSRKKYQQQETVWNNVLNQRLAGNDALFGLMLESHLKEGSQKCDGNGKNLAFGMSITDACISWKTTEKLLREAYQKLGENFKTYAIKAN